MTTRAAAVRPADRLTLKDRLSRLTFTEAPKLLGPEGKTLIQRNANAWDFKLPDDVYLGGDLFRLRFPEKTAAGTPLTVTITLMAEARQRLHWHCTGCACPIALPLPQRARGLMRRYFSAAAYCRSGPGCSRSAKASRSRGKRNSKRSASSRLPTT